MVRSNAERSFAREQLTAPSSLTAQAADEIIAEIGRISLSRLLPRRILELALMCSSITFLQRKARADVA
jgi:hypothetical protein